MQREKWVPTYLRNSLCIGISKTQESENINKFFKNYIRSRAMLRVLSINMRKHWMHAILKREKDVKTKISRPILKWKKWQKIFMQESLF